MKKWQKLLLGVTGTVSLLAISGIIILKMNITPPAKAALDALSTAEVTSEGYYFKGEKSKPLILFAPGALIDVRSYGVWAKELADQGYGVYLMSMPLELSLLDSHKAQKIIKNLNPESFILGGHSMGGVATSQVATKYLDDPKLKGIFYLSSYAPGGELAASHLSTLVLTGSRDVDITDQEIRNKKDNFPNDAQIITLEGGDHMGFANTKKGTPQALISAKEQNQQVADKLLNWLASL